MGHCITAAHEKTGWDFIILYQHNPLTKDLSPISPFIEMPRYFFI